MKGTSLSSNTSYIGVKIEYKFPEKSNLSTRVRFPASSFFYFAFSDPFFSHFFSPSTPDLKKWYRTGSI